MNDDAIYAKYREIIWRRPLTAAEQTEWLAWLAVHPQAQADWELETEVSRALEHLPTAPLPSNFAARALRAVDLEVKVRLRRRHAVSWLRPWRWLPRTAWVVVVGAAGLVTWHHLYDLRQEKYEYARSVVAVSKVESLPNPGVLENFDAIRVLDQTPGPDEELLKLYQ